MCSNYERSRYINFRRARAKFRRYIKALLYELIIKYSINRIIIIASHDPNIVFKKSNKILHFDGQGAIHYDKINELNENSANAKIKDLFEGYFACKHS